MAETRPQTAAERQARRRERDPDRVRAQRRDYYARHRLRLIAEQQAIRAADRSKYRARKKVEVALRNGSLKKGPCEQQNASCVGRVEAHHDDYSKPLEVRWLCQSHHQREHLAEAA